ncbi:MAG: glycoside hydrolase [Opitutaceae bacterium]|nr:glycoside hydrolase [Opitutaceae bacterium]
MIYNIIIKIAYVSIVGWFALAGNAMPGQPIRALAQEHVVFDRSPDPLNIPLYTPSILRLPDGRLVAASERGGTWQKQGNHRARIAISDDGGISWKQQAGADIIQGRLFKAGNAVYYLGHLRDLKIMRSDDNGATWSGEFALTSGQSWHQTAANVWHAKGNVYLVMERYTSHEIKGWPVGELAPVLMRAKEKDDLTKRESWTFASEITFANIISGYRENKPQLSGVGIPFFEQSYPVSTMVTRHRAMAPIGWLETNVVQIVDPDHYWFDPAGATFHLFMRAHTGGTGFASLAKVTENQDGSMTTSLVQAPSGQAMLFLPFPGGQMRFHVVYDRRTKLYWLLGTQATDSMTRADRLPVDRYNIPNNERQRLALHFSKNMVDWCFAGLVAVGPGNKGSRHYASMDIDGDDLVILARSGDRNAKSAHEGNLITFHRVRNFRALVY